MRAASLCLAIICVVFFSLAPRIAWADWPPLGRAISTADQDQERPMVAPDGAGGSIVVWLDFRNKRVNIFARRVLASGNLDPAWPVDGQALLTDAAALDSAFEVSGSPSSFPMARAGRSSRGRTGAARRMGSTSTPNTSRLRASWTPRGPRMGERSARSAVNGEDLTIVSDGAGGAIVTWMDGRSGITDFDIFAQHVLASGVVDPAWLADGIALCTAPGPQMVARCVSPRILKRIRRSFPMERKAPS